MNEAKLNVSPEEIAKFKAMSQQWWQPNGEMKLLHQLNPLRLQYIQKFISLKNQKILDVGCGGGILTEAIANCGAQATGIDLCEPLIAVAEEHAIANGLNITYEYISIEDYARAHTHSFDAVTCMELLEHVPDPKMIINACNNALKPGGFFFLATINRNLKAFLSAIVGAEYLLNMLPKGTHEYAKLIRPSELTQWCEASGFELIDLQGIHYHPLTGHFNFDKNVDINYLMAFKKSSERDG